MRWTCPVLAVAVTMTTYRSATAEPESLPLDLVWDAPKDCRDEASIRQRVEELVAGRPPPSLRVVATARVRTPATGRFSLVLTVRTGAVEEERTIDAGSCTVLAEAAAVVIALALAPPADAPRTEERPTSTEVQEPAGARPASDTSAVERSAAAQRRPPSQAEQASFDRAPPAESGLRFVLGLGPAVATGTLPSVGAGMGAHAGLRHHGLRLGLLGTTWLRQRPTFDGRAGATFDVIEAGVFGCYMFEPLRFAFGPCANVEATFARVEGVGIRAPKASSSYWPTIVAGVRGEVAVARWLGAFARADVVVPVDAPRFGLEGSLLHLHEPAPVGSRFTLGAEIVVP